MAVDDNNEEIQIPEALAPEYDDYQTQIADLNSTRSSSSYKKGQKFHKLIDVEQQRRDIMADPSLYHAEDKRYTQKGKRQLAAAQAVDDAQKAGYRILPTKNGKFAIVDENDNVIDPDESIVHGTTDADKGLFSFMNKNSISHKATSRFIGHAMANNLYISDPRYAEAQESFEGNRAIDDKIQALRNKWDATFKGYNLAGGSNGVDGIDGKDGKDGKPAARELIKGIDYEGAFPVHSKKADLKDIQFGDDLDIPDIVKTPTVGPAIVETSDWQEFRNSFDLDIDELDKLGAAAALFTTAGAFSSGNASNISFAAGTIMNTIDAAIDEDRSGLWEGATGLAALLGSMGNFKAGARKQGLKALATAIPPNKRARMVVQLSKKIEQLANSKTAQYYMNGIAGGYVVGDFVVELAALRDKANGDGQIDINDIMHIITRMAQVGAVTKMATRMHKLKTQGITPVDLTKYRVPKAKRGEFKKKPPRKKKIEAKKPEPKAEVNTEKKKISLKDESPVSRQAKANQRTPKEEQRTPKKEASKSKPVRKTSNSRSYEEGGSVVFTMPVLTVENMIRSYSTGGKLIQMFQSSGVLKNEPAYNPVPSMAASPVDGVNPFTQGYGTRAIASAANVAPQSATLAESKWLLDRDKSKDVQLSNGQIIYEFTLGSTKVYVNMSKPNQVFTDWESLKNSLDKQSGKEYGKARVAHDANSNRTPFATATGAFRGTVPWKVIGDIALNEIAYRNRETSPFIESQATPYTPLPVYAAKAQPWETTREQKDQVLASTYDARAMSSDPMANMINERRIGATELKGMNSIRAAAAEWNRGQIERQEDQEIQSVRQLGEYRIRESDRINRDLMRKQQYLDQNAATNNRARNTYLRNWGTALSNLQDNWNMISSNIQNPNKARLQNQMAVLHQTYRDEAASNNNPDTLAAIMSQMDEISAQIAGLSRRDAGGAKILWGGDRSTTAGYSGVNDAGSDVLD